MKRPRCLDLFCGAGGAAMGLYRAGFDVIGIDIKPQPRYPFPFIQADALKPPVRLEDFDLIWASPPCQVHIRSGCFDKSKHVDLIPQTRSLLEKARMSVIENVPGSPLRVDLQLCGSAFGLKVRRHRWFEASGRWLPPMTLACHHSQRICSISGHPRGKSGAWPHGKRPNLPDTRETWSDAMGIDWMNTKEISQSIPPAYSEHIGRCAMIALGRAVA